MRKLVLELPRDEISKIWVGEQPFQNIKLIELIHFLRQDKEETSGIFRIESKNSVFSVNDLLKDGITEAQILEQEKNGAYIVFIKVKPVKGSFARCAFEETSGYLLPPFEIQEEKLKLTFLGSTKQVTDFLEKMEKLKIHLKIVSLRDAKFSSEPLDALTEKQKKVLANAYKLGYYDFPRKINSEELSQRLNIHSSALVAHRRKAERRLLAQIFNE